MALLLNEPSRGNGRLSCTRRSIYRIHFVTISLLDFLCCERRCRFDLRFNGRLVDAYLLTSPTAEHHLTEPVDGSVSHVFPGLVETIQLQGSEASDPWS